MGYKKWHEKNTPGLKNPMDVFVCMIRWYWGYQTVYLCNIHPKQNDTIHFSKQLFFHKNFASVSLEFVQSIG